MPNASEVPKKTAEAANAGNCDAATPSDQQVEQAALLALLRLLMREPPPDHDFKTCLICKRHGITEI